eukprot:CAMPEP_0172172560 /NCGR_PEP_ID=MMETSP1050-20130122/12518_1 /TAXON_ID=233186 /ORGANISM="Cryptomonas curvata, Strain CCAP979/52" /LENGTH=251 /DNA_ID=CAMNT_0012844121 /DNA_START=59 /DNA_END=810 /DNA_ORIENTATION=-
MAWNQDQKIKRNGFVFAKLIVLIAFAVTTDAFKSTALRALHFQTKKSSGLAKHHDFLNLRQRKNSLSFTKKLRAAGTLEDINVAQENFKSWNDDEYNVAQENFKSWNDALKAKDYEKASALYCTTDLTFLPTVSPDFIRDAPSTKRYFQDFVKRLPDGKITDDSVQFLSADSYLHTGMYTFMTGPDDDRTPVSARFTYMWRKSDGRWKIIHHHSSAVPGNSNTKIVDHYPTAQKNFKTWNDALKQKDFEKV